MLHRGALMKKIISLSLFAAFSGCAGGAAVDDLLPEEVSAGLSATTYNVGPGQPYSSLQQVSSLLKPGDVVQVYGNATYSSVSLSKSGTAAAPITIRGVRVNGKRPVFSGGTNTLDVSGNYQVLEGIEVKGGSSRCIFHRANGITIRDSFVHDCPQHGILGADNGSGSLTLEYVEVSRSGSGTGKHPIYMATDEKMYPGAVFRMEHCYLHDQTGGHSVKSRAERNEIYYNWIEGATYRELELIGPDPSGGVSASLKREDSDVVGNVIVKKQGRLPQRIGGDGTGSTGGRYRFVNNTFILQSNSSAAIMVFDEVESLEMHDNIFYRIGGGKVEIVDESTAKWTKGRQVTGQNNWMPTGSTGASGLTNSLTGTDPGFVNVGSYDVRLKAGAAVIDRGVENPATSSNYPFPRGLPAPLMLPPLHQLEAVGTAASRPRVGTIDIGAFEYGTGSPTIPTPPPPSTPPTPPEGGCVTASERAPLVGAPMAAGQTGQFTVTATVTPSAAGVDGAFGLAQGDPRGWTSFAASVSFAPDNMITARNGRSNLPATLSYRPGVAYRVRLVVDVPRHTYSAFVTPEGGSELTVGTDLDFRSEQANVNSLDTFVTAAGPGELQTCNADVR